MTNNFIDNPPEPGTGLGDQSSEKPLDNLSHETDTKPVMGKPFSQLGISELLVKALHNQDITYAFPIQELTLPIALAGHDIIGQARTGTGKTLGFTLPAIEQIKSLPLAADNKPYALIVVPTRELCIQVYSEILALISYINQNLPYENIQHMKVAALYGGHPTAKQRIELQHANIVVGTPGRLLDFLSDESIDFSSLKIVVLDEADEMLDLGFLPEIDKIFTHLPAQRQTLLFSATLPSPIMSLTRKFLHRPTHIHTENDANISTHHNINQFVYRAHNLDKDEVISKILQAKNRGATIIFTRTKRQAVKLYTELENRGFHVGSIHGDLNQQLREKHLSSFRSGTTDVLVATDIAARGIDIDNITHVINYQSPDDENTYVHRIGRTARAGKTGIAITLVDWEDIDRWKNINSALNLRFSDPQETYSTSAHLYTDLDIPSDLHGYLDRKTTSHKSTTNKYNNVDKHNKNKNDKHKHTLSSRNKKQQNSVIKTSGSQVDTQITADNQQKTTTRQRRRRIITNN